MLPVLEESWTRVQKLLRERVGEAVHTAWIAGLRPVLMERGTVYLEAQNRLTADRVRTMFRPVLEEVLSADFGTPLAVELQARDSLPFDALEVSPQQPVVDDANSTAHLVLRSLSDGRPLPSNLFYFYGPSGVGKTFLLRWWRERSAQRPLWFELMDLLKAFQAAHYERRVDGLRDELVQDKPLVIDELHRVAGKPKLQQFLIQVLRTRDTLKSPTLLASRWQPKDVRDLDPTLQTLCLAGFVTGIDRPGPSARLRFLRALDGTASRNGRAKVVESIAQQCCGSYPELRVAWASSRGAPMPPRYLELIDPGRVFARLRDEVARRLGVSVQDLLGNGQGRAVSRARKVLAMACRRNGLSGSEVGRFLNGRTRAAISYMVKSLEKELERSPELRAQLEDLR